MFSSKRVRVHHECKKRAQLNRSRATEFHKKRAKCKASRTTLADAMSRTLHKIVAVVAHDHGLVRGCQTLKMRSLQTTKSSHVLTFIVDISTKQSLGRMRDSMHDHVLVPYYCKIDFN